MMWEVIESNKRKSIFLFVGMFLCLVGLGYLIGYTIDPIAGGNAGILISVLIWAGMLFFAIFGADSYIRQSVGAQEVTPEVHAQLFNIVDEMRIASGMKTMPKIYIIDRSDLNAFATGVRERDSAITVTAGLLGKLNRDELQGVIAHEMSHILNRDVLYMTFAIVFLGSIQLISQIFLRSGRFHSSDNRYRSKSRGGGGQWQLILFVITLLLSILGPVLIRLMYFSLSRKREYLADACGARLTRYPEGLASALEKIAQSSVVSDKPDPLSSPMYISNPLEASNKSQAMSFLSTHPPIGERVRILRSMGQAASFFSYQMAFESVTGKKSILPHSSLKDSAEVPARSATSAEKNNPLDPKTQARLTGDLMMSLNQFTFLACVCGLKIKVPPQWRSNDVLTCPSCRRSVTIPLASVSTQDAEATAEKKASTQRPQLPEPSYERRGVGYETFRCVCTKPLTISPIFIGHFLTCVPCGRKIRIVGPVQEKLQQQLRR